MDAQQAIDKATQEINEALNDLATIRSGTQACSGYIGDMSRASNRLNTALALLRDAETHQARTDFALIILRLKQRGVITEADAARWAEAEVAYGG